MVRAGGGAPASLAAPPALVVLLGVQFPSPARGNVGSDTGSSGDSGRTGDNVGGSVGAQDNTGGGARSSGDNVGDDAGSTGDNAAGTLAVLLAQPAWGLPYGLVPVNAVCSGFSFSVGVSQHKG